MKLLYVTYIDFGDFRSGSSVRPQMMYRAFEELGCEIKLLQTQQNRRAERRAAVAEIDRWLDRERPDLCYVESPSGPIFNACDRRLLRRVSRMVPTGYFLRDAAYRFDEVFVQGKKTLKQRAIAALSERDVRFFAKTIPLMYLPTESMAGYFSFPRVKPLLPGCVGRLSDRRGNRPQRRCIYVGGVSPRYGSATLLEAFRLLNQGGEQYPLTLVCREAEAQALGSAQSEPWLTVAYASGKEALKPLYDAADLALYPVSKNVYNDFAFSVKLMEYLEFGLPVVTTDCAEAARFTRAHGTGLVSQDDPASFAEAIREMFRRPGQYEACLDAAYRALDGNRWTDRARQVLQDLGG